MDPALVAEHAAKLATDTARLAADAAKLALESSQVVPAAGGAAGDPFTVGLTVFVLACFVGYYVVWRVTPALHSPLMAVTNAISSVIIVGALLAAGPAEVTLSQIFGFVAVILASINIFGGFVVTQRMLSKFKKKNEAAR
ncbi:MAG: NAD(P) transhydrogenase subunit alpha [Rhodospirillaceae bacterium]|nr:NAD(P) transhydrogenase subunit alpha [Rhodospirillaceae bacterium]